MSRYVVTGCAGFIGSHLAERLLTDGHEVVGIDSFTPFYDRASKERNLSRALRSPCFFFREADLVDGRQLDLEGVDGVFHLAGEPGTRASWGTGFPNYTVNNVVATQRLLEIASGEDIRVVLASSSSIYGDAQGYPTSEDVRPNPISPYGITKLACEHLARAYDSERGLEIVTLRYFSVYGPRQRPDMAIARLMAAARSGAVFAVYGSGAQSRDFTFVHDAVAATIAAMASAPAGAVYNVGGGSEATLRDVIALVGEFADSELRVSYEDGAAGDPLRTSADTTRIGAEIGWLPRTDLRDGLRQQYEANGTLA
jgi:UDP-glucuronate 4-epimerase